MRAALLAIVLTRLAGRKLFLDDRMIFIYYIAQVNMRLECGSPAAAFLICGRPVYLLQGRFPVGIRLHTTHPAFAQFWCNVTSFRINTCELSCKC